MACLVYLAVIFQLAVHCVRTDPTITPATYQVIKIPGNLTVVGSFLHPLVGCRIRISGHYDILFDKVLDFSHRRASEKVNLHVSNYSNLTANFEGRSPDECGVAIQADFTWAFYHMLIEIYGQSEGGDWSRGWALVLMTDDPVIDYTSPTPLLMVAKPGSSVSVLLKTRDAMGVCAIKIPAEDEVHLSPGESLPPDSRYRVHGAGRDNGECGYTLTNLTTRDSGVWWWYGEHYLSYAYRMTIVLISSAPLGKPVLSVHDASRLRVGYPMKATCHAPPSVPPPKLTWLLDGQVVRHDDDNATLPGDVAKSLPWEPQGAVQTFTRTLSSQDFGKRLDCRAEHSAGVDSVGVVLTPYFTVTAESPLIRTAVGHLTELACIVEAGLTTTVQWHRSGVPVNPSLLVAIGNDGTRHWLKLEHVTLAEMTNFTCTASNELGSESKVIQLTGLPGTPKWKEGTSPPQLAWTVETLEELTSCKLKVRRGKDRWQEHEVVDGVRRLNDTWVLVQHHLQVKRAGNYSAFLIVRNVHGESMSLSFQTFSLNATADTSLPTPTTAVTSLPTPTTAVTLPATPIAAARTGCPALVNPSLSVQCTLAGKVVDCSVGPVPLGTNAGIECVEGSKPSEEQHGVRKTTCTAGRWRPKPLVCVLDCGFRRHAATPRVLGGEESSEGEFPWHVAVFEKKRDSFEPICGGSLITRRFFVSAAHCFWNETTRQLKNVSLYNAVVGKHSLSWETRDPYEQRLQIKAIHIPDLYAGFSKRLEADIAVVQLSAPINITPETNVVCIDWTTQTEYQQLTINSNGTVPGWGLTESNSMSPILRYVDLPYVPYLKCRDLVPGDYRNFLLGDKMCGGFHNRSTGVCQGDSGGGFVFAAQRTVGTRYILRGVVSSGPRRFGSVRTQCMAEHFSSFTTVSSYVTWMKRIVFSDDDEER